MDNSQALELQIQAKAHEAKSSVESLVKSLTNVENVLTNIYLEMGSIEKKTDSSVNKATTATKNINQLKQSTDKATSSADKLGNVFKKVFTFAGVKRVTGQLLGWTNEAIDYTEQLNLFNVVFDNTEKDGKQMFSELGKSALQFQYKMNEAFGTNKTQTLYMQGIFESMGETVGIEDTYSTIMSETMTKLTYDLSSLYNKTENTTAEAIRAGVYAGQTKPLRSYGIDVTQSSLQPIVKELGITDENGDVKSVKNMSQAEKEILRYIATVKQAKIAMGDLANTIESPSNQLKIFRQQLVEAKVALSSLFIGSFSKIMPYANAILMVIKEVSKAIASMFGIELKDYNAGLASQEGIYDGIADSADDATDAVKELKRQTLGFDEIHNIDESKNSSSGTTSSSGGIDQRLLDAIRGYDNGMDKVKMKATEIRDKIMEWLGFTKEIDPLTGEVSFKYGGIKKTLSNMWNSFKGLSTEGKIIVGLIGTLIGYKIYSGIVNISKKILGTNDLLKLSGNNLTTLGKITKSLKVSGWNATISKVGSTLKNTISIVGKTSIAIAGLTTAIIGTAGVYNSMKKMTSEANYGGEAFGKYTASILATVSGTTALGTVIGGPLGAAIGALTGVIIAGTSALLGYNAGIEKLAKDDLFGTVSISTAEWTSMLNNLNISINDNTSRFETLQANLSSLNDTFDSSSSKLDMYGLKFGKLSQKITDEDSVNINNAISEMCDSANSIIDANTSYSLEIWGTTFDRMSTITEDEEKDILNSILTYGENQKVELKSAQDNITNTYQNAIATRGYLTDEEYKYISEQLEKIRQLTNNSMSKSQTDIEYYKTMFADKNKKLDEQSYKDFQTALDNYHKEKKKSIEDTYNQLLNNAKSYYESGAIDYNQYLYAKNTADQQRYDDTQKLEEEILKFQDDVTKSLKQKYIELLNDNKAQAKAEKKIIEGILDKDTINNLKRNYGNAGETSAKAFSDKLNNNLINPLNNSSISLSITADTKKARSKVNSLISDINSSGLPSVGIGSAFGKLGYIPQYANGGFPEDGLFFANHKELVGKFSNGKTAVANNGQIESGIEEAAYRGYMRAIADSGMNGGQSNEIDVHVHTDEGTVIDRIEQRTKQTGVFPFTIPTY